MLFDGCFFQRFATMIAREKYHLLPYEKLSCTTKKMRLQHIKKKLQSTNRSDKLVYTRHVRLMSNFFNTKYSNDHLTFSVNGGGGGVVVVGIYRFLFCGR